jgi:thioredoxin-related protein
MTRVIVLCAIGWITLFAGSKPLKVAEPAIQWKSLPQAESANQLHNRPVIIDLYTDWCGWCKVMDKKTYTNKKVIQYLEEKFYAVKLNAETRDEITWSGKTFKFNPSYKINDIAVYLTQGNLAFPTTVFIPANGAAPQAIPGYLTPKQIEILLKYFGEDNYGKISFEAYKKTFKGEW